MIYLALAILYLLILDRPTFQLLKLPLVQHLFGAALCLLMVLWQLKGQLPESPPVHFLGVTTLVIVLGTAAKLVIGTTSVIDTTSSVGARQQHRDFNR